MRGPGAGRDDAAYAEVRVVLRAGAADVRAWTAEVDAGVPVAELRDDLVLELGVGRPEDFRIRREGSLRDPVLVLTMIDAGARAEASPRDLTGAAQDQAGKA